MNHAIIYLYN